MSKSITLPQINIRDVVLYPGAQVTLYIGRPFTIQTLEHAKRQTRGRVIAVTQRAVENMNPTKISEIFQTGTLCKIVQGVRLSDGSMKVLIEAIQSFRVAALAERGGIRFASGNLIEKKVDVAVLKEGERKEILELLVRWNPSVVFEEENTQFEELKKERRARRFLNLVLQLMGSTPKPAFSKKKKASYFQKQSPAWKAKMNQGIAERQRILEEPATIRQVKMIRTVLRREIVESLRLR